MERRDLWQQREDRDAEAKQVGRDLIECGYAQTIHGGIIVTEAVGIGPQRIDRYRGWLTFDYLPDELQRAEDSTLHRDNRIDRDCFDRPATAAEITLLTYLGYQLPAALMTRVSRVSATLRHRSWHALEDQTQPNGSSS